MKKHVKRYLSLALTFALVFAIPFAFTQEASAASKKSGKVTVYKVTSEATTTNYSDGTKATSSSKYTYNKKGFMTKNIYSSSDGYYFKDVYKYNGKGYMTSSKTYNKKGKLTNLTKVTMKKGKPSVRKYYTVKGKKKKLTYQEKLIYKGKKLVKIEWKDLIEKTKGERRQLFFWTMIPPINTNQLRHSCYQDCVLYHGTPFLRIISITTQKKLFYCMRILKNF